MTIALGDDRLKADTNECYIRGKLQFHPGEADGSMFLVCERPQCRLGDGGIAIPFQQQLPDRCLPETAVMIRAKHLATHRDLSWPEWSLSNRAES